MQHTIYCQHSRLAACQPNDIISVLAGPLKRRLAGLICIVHPTGCTTGCTTDCTIMVVQPAVKRKHCVKVLQQQQPPTELLIQDDTGEPISAPATAVIVQHL